ncbi:MAG: hypothetical protein HXX10_08470 [Rhodoplanes sp.]|uniref:hypothetical protein n=1 Tax=Rhodoplanes sp. TaxID=1968906 RepID=UPI00179E5A09|nr:hypothetical protein [Rhodoplanes sp.]NVO14055.1 hypothetical protein [Rhodoplanes sp.]
MPYDVQIDENLSYMGASNRTSAGTFATADAAIAKCKAIVDDELAGMFKPGMGAAELFELWSMFGDDPFIPDPAVTFSADSYARTQSEVIAGGRSDPAR